MKKQIYSEKVYLSGDKTAMDTFLEKKEKENLLHVLERIANKDAIKEYNRYWLLERDFLKSLGLKTSIENAIALSYLIHHGYLSYNMKFSPKATDNEIKARYGMTILKGYGCCRNFSDMGKDIMKLLDYYVKNLYCYQPNLSLPKSAYMKQANHVINLIMYDGIKYGIDLYQGCALYYFKNSLTLERISQIDNSKIRFKPYYEITTGEGDLESIHKELEEFGLESKKPHLSPLIYEQDILPDTKQFMENKKRDLIDFHNETNEMKEHIVLSLTK